MKTSWAVLIDAENIPVAGLEPLLKLVRLRGDIDIARVYGNMERQPGWVKAATEHGLVLRSHVQLTGRKNGADIALAIDAMKLMHAGYPPGFLIVSSDSDFVPLAQELRASGRRVVGAGDERATEALRAAYHDWLDLGPRPQPETQPEAPQIVTPQIAAPDVPFARAARAAINGSEWMPATRLGTILIKSGHHKKGGGLRKRLKACGFRERELARGVVEIARPL